MIQLHLGEVDFFDQATLEADLATVAALAKLAATTPRQAGPAIEPLARAREQAQEWRYSSDQVRDEHGRWSVEGGLATNLGRAKHLATQIKGVTIVSPGSVAHAGWLLPDGTAIDLGDKHHGTLGMKLGFEDPGSAISEMLGSGWVRVEGPERDFGGAPHSASTDYDVGRTTPEKLSLVEGALNEMLDKGVSADYKIAVNGSGLPGPGTSGWRVFSLRDFVEAGSIEKALHGSVDPFAYLHAPRERTGSWIPFPETRYSENQPRDDAGRFAGDGSANHNTGNLNGSHSPAVLAAINAAVAELVPLKYERAIVIAPDGTRFLTKDGTATGFNITAQAPDIPPGSVLLHNHPSGAGRGFSPADMALGPRLDLAEHRLISGPWIYVVRPPSGGWKDWWFGPNNGDLVQSEAYQKFLDRNAHIDRNTGGYVPNKDHTKAELEQSGWHEVDGVVADKLGLDYFRVPR